MEKINCLSCDEYHDFKNMHYSQCYNCVPTLSECQFGEYKLPRTLRDDLSSSYTVEELVGTYLGLNPEYKYCNKRTKTEKESDDLYLQTIGVERIW